jgi:MFS family permease
MAVDSLQASAAVAVTDRSAAVAEWKAHWPLVFTSMCGLSFASVAAYSMGLFIEPLTREFGWTRAQVSLGLTIFSMFAVPLSPFAGALIDRFGPRRMAIPGMALAGVAFASLSFANGSVSQWVALWVCYSLAALAIKTTVWTAAVSSVFSASRGFALAVALCGTAVAQTLSPVIAQWIIDNHGWRNAYLWMGLGWSLFVLVLLMFFFFGARDSARVAEKRSNQNASSGAVGATPELPGLSPRQAIRSPQLIKIAIVCLIASTIGIAIAVHKVPILTESGVTRQAAAWLAATAGIAGIFGKLLTGWLLDRWTTGWIPGVSIALPALALALLLEPLRTPATIVCAMVLLGYASGAMLQATTYQTTRYGGLRHFGKIFGVMASMFGLGTGIGPVLAGFVHDEFASYTPLIVAGIPAMLVCGVLIGRLGPYPDWTSGAQGVAHRR